jgi:hypothetical protein
VDETPNLKLPYILAAQAQKHVTHNEAIRALDAIVQTAVLDSDLTVPPASPTDGDRYIVAPGATAAWLGKDGQIAAFQDGAWSFYAPREGWIAWVADEDRLYAWDGAAWIVAGGGGVNPTPLVGVNATADTTNRLAVSSPASLFNHEGAGHQLKVNKHAAGDTGSVLLDTNFSGRAEMGLAGDDDCHVKVSANGTTWHEAIVIDRTSGNVSFPNTPGLSGSGSLAGSDGQLQYNNGGSFGGASGFRWNDTTNVVEVDTSIELAGTTGTNAGVIKQAGDPILHNYGTQSSFVGRLAGNFTMSGMQNVGFGFLALAGLTSGCQNVAIGPVAGVSITTGIGNFALGALALYQNITANANVALGYLALSGLTGGSGSNIGIGQQAGYTLTTGAENILIGTGAGSSLDATANGNIIIGSNAGASGFSNTAILAPGGTERMRINSSGHTTFQGAVAPKSYTVATVPSASAAGAGAMIYVTDETGGAVPAFSDATNWRRVTDRAIIS